MEQKQAEAMVNAILDPDPKVQQDLRRKREAETRALVVSRYTAAFVLLGFASGLIVAYFLGERFSVGGLWGGIGGAVLGQVVGAGRVRRRAV